VWVRTHQLAARLFVLAALLPWAAVPFSRAAAFWLLVAGISVAALGSALYSLAVYRQQQG
jgi:hypothetical protein